MKTLYLHIGTPKTGTSSIQEFMCQNREVLKKHGYCYPELLRRDPGTSMNRNGHFLVHVVYSEDGTRDKALEEEIKQEGLEQVAECFKQVDNVVLSDEGIWRRLPGHAYAKVLPDLKEEADRRGYQVKIIVYLRRQDEYLISNWNQMVKHRMRSTLTADERIWHVVNKEPGVVKYATQLDSMAKIFGKENLIVRRFDSGDWVNGDIIEDFMNCIGLSVTEEYQPLEKNANTGLQGNTTEMKRIINKDTTFTGEEVSYLGSILRSLSYEAGKRYPSSALSQEEIRKLLEIFKEENDRAAEEYMQDGKPMFSDEIKDLPKWQADNPYMQEDMIRFFSAVAIDLRRENRELRDEIKELRAAMKEERKNLSTFKYKLHHPLRTIWNRLFHRRKGDLEEE